MPTLSYGPSLRRTLSALSKLPEVQLSMRWPYVMAPSSASFFRPGVAPIRAKVRARMVSCCSEVAGYVVLPNIVETAAVMPSEQTKEKKKGGKGCLMKFLRD